MGSRLSASYIAAFAGLMFLAFVPPLLQGQGSESRSLPLRPKKGVVVPFEYVHNLILVKLSLNGSPPVSFSLDTGADTTSLDRQAVDAAHLRAVMIKGELNALSGTCALGPVAQGIHLKVGKNELLRGSGLVLDLSQFEKPLGIPLAGIFGFDYLRQFPVLLDYRAKTITIFADKKVRYSGLSALIVPLEKGKEPGKPPSLPVIAVQLELPDGSSAEAKLTIDTGFDGALGLHGPFVREHPSVQAAPSANPPAGPLYNQAFCGDKYEAELGKVSAIRLGGTRFSAPDVVYSKTPAGIADSSETDGELGNKFLSQFRIFFDVPRNVIVFEPLSDR
jgi:hypothetical protein